MLRLEPPLIAATVVLYAASFVLGVSTLVTGRDRTMVASRWAVVVGFAAHSGALLARWTASGHVPIATPYENAVMGSWSIILMTFLAPRRSRLFGVAGTGAVALAVLIAGWALMQPDTASPLAPSLKSVWLYVHVFFAFLAYAAFSVASGAALGYLAKQRRGGAGALGRLPPLPELDLLAHRYVVFGFITCAVMIASGSIWAKDLWGSYWSWDPVETWSLVAWLVYGLLIHLRVTYGWQGSRYAWFALVAVGVVVVAYFGVGAVFSATQHVFTVPPPPTF